MAASGEGKGAAAERPRAIVHADMDAFYASIEQRDRPELRGRPVVVGGTGDRGVVSAASYEARPYGVRSAMPTVEARRLCPDAVFLRGDLRRYAAESRRIFAIFRRFTPEVEGLSLDEAFLDLTGSERLLGPPAEVGAALRRAVREETQLAVSVGIAPAKMVAKIASDLAKPDGLLEVRPERVPAFLAPLPVGRIPGVGPVGQERLRRAGFRTLGDLAAAETARLRDALGEDGPALARLARGEDLRAVEPFREAASVGEENTFPRDVDDRPTLDAAIAEHAEAVARRLRRSGTRARTVVLKWKAARRVAPGPRGHPVHTRRRTLAEPTDDGRRIGEVARGLLESQGPRSPVRLLGVTATGLVRAGEGAQLALFGPGAEAERRSALERAIDALTERFGPEAVRRADAAAPERAAPTLRIKRGEE